MRGQYWQRSYIYAFIPSGLERDLVFEYHLMFSFLPFEFEVGFAEFCWLYKLHVINSDFLSDEVWLLETCLVVIVNETVNNSEF